ncbi:arabinogalactan endo-1,4-beta-galactosidase [Mycena olivaceomarginata]|nr:arabinogalactan endo-1,4-beta-galactosidase [Mycena olivaceomarginata]
MRFSLSAILRLLDLSRASARWTYHGADFSSLVNLENAGRTYHDSCDLLDKLETIPSSSMERNLARIRIWTSTNHAAYRADTASSSDPRWMIGNEINDGMLWPTGRISVNGYSPLSQLMHSAVSGARSSSSTIKTVVPFSPTAGVGSAVASFYNQIFIAGEFAIADGFSFYPFYGTGATFAALKSSFAGNGDQNVMVVETDWPASLLRSGQQAWVLGIKNVLAALTGSHGIGIIYWEPAWPNKGLGSSCSDALLVDGSGNTRASIAMFSADM